MYNINLSLVAFHCFEKLFSLTDAAENNAMWCEKKVDTNATIECNKWANVSALNQVEVIRFNRTRECSFCPIECARRETQENMSNLEML